jgi:Protein of unknown function (DUF4238)
MKSKNRGRKDHYLPQGYLRGFTHPCPDNPQKPLWHFDVHHKKWRQYSEAEIGFHKGFYDPIASGTELEIADETFAELERKFPLVRKEILTNFDAWLDHRDFLLHFMQMMRARSPLFFQEKKEEQEGQQIMEVVSVGLKPAFIKNRTLMEMRDEILKGPAELHEFSWGLRWTDDPDSPCVTSDTPFVMEGMMSDRVEAWKHNDTWLYFPICWQAVLFGTRYRIDMPTDRFSQQDLVTLRTKYRQNAAHYLVAPVRLEEF